MSVAILVVSTGDRVDMLNDFIRSAKGHLYRIYAVLQGYDHTPEGIFEAIHLPDPVGAHGARIIGLEKWYKNHSAWVVVDDDMELTTRTNFITPGLKIQSRNDIGFISCNWGRTLAMTEKKPIKDEYKQQAIVYTGGGLIFNRDTAELLMEKLPSDRKFVTDNTMWSLATYTSGKINGRYLGSLAVHHILRPGGRKAFLHANESERPPSDLVNSVESAPMYQHAANNMNMPVDNNLTQHARDLHKANRALYYGARAGKL